MSTTATTAVWNHSESKGSARLVLLAMADEANDQGLLTAYRRSQSWFAKKARVDAGTVKRAIATLVELGELEILARGDGRASSDYRLVLPDLRPLDEGVQDAPPGVAPRPPRGGKPHPQGVQDAPPTIPLLPPSDPGPTQQRASDAQLADAFDRFWTAYPRKTAKGAARKAWPRAVKAAGDPELIIAGATRYAADPNRDQRYTAHASTWLNAERWGDEPEPPRAGRAQARPIATDRDAPSGRLEL